MRSARLEYEARRLFYTLEHSTMEKAQIAALIRQWQDTALEAGEDERIINGPLSSNRIDSAETALSVALEETHEALVSGEYGAVAGEVDELLAAHNLTRLDHGSESYKRLARELLKAKVEVFRVELERWQGEYRHNGSAAVHSPIPSAKERTPSKPFSEVAALYFKEHKRAQRTDEQIQSSFKKFLVIIGGDKPIGDITKADCRQYKETLLKSVGIATVNKNLHNLSHLWNWALGQGFVQEGSTSPVAGLLINKRLAKKEKLQRKPFTDSDLAAILGHKEFLSQRVDCPERYWLVLCLLLSGARREEIAQLAVADIQHADGIHYFDITNEGESQSLKNQGSKRWVPIHSELVRLGFIDYVGKQRRGGRLFPQLEKGSNGYGDAVGKWFGRLLRQFLRITDPGLVLHSTRHTVITRLHAAGVPTNLVEILVGHASNTVHGTVYVHREDIRSSCWLMRLSGWSILP